MRYGNMSTKGRGLSEGGALRVREEQMGGGRAPNPKDPLLEALPGVALAVAPIEKELEAGVAPAEMHMLAEAKNG